MQRTRLASVLGIALTSTLLPLPASPQAPPRAWPAAPETQPHTALLVYAPDPQLLPEAPSASLAPPKTAAPVQPPCPTVPARDDTAASAQSPKTSAHPCPPDTNPFHRFFDNVIPGPLTARQKGYLAFRDVIDPGNLATIATVSAFTIAINAHTAYGPGLPGFARNASISLSQDATGEFVGTFAIASLTHEEPRYHRLPHASIGRRLVHAVSRTVIAQHDDGRNMPNYETLLTYPISAEISNLYVPGVRGNGPSTVQRFMIGYATDPVDNIITEFLPDFAKRIHVRIIFVQQILNQIATDQYTVP